MNVSSSDLAKIKNHLTQELVEQREGIQNDLLTILDGLGQAKLDSVCQMIVNRFKAIENLVIRVDCKAFLDELE